MIRIVPKGLRSFDSHDADFFLELLPGPQDRDGLPDSIRFWKTRIEETDPDETFPVGLIYGPSGCGKSSLVKAGLLPRLAAHVVPVYIEATSDETESRLLHGLRKRCPDLPTHLDSEEAPGRKVPLGLKESLAALRQGQGIGRGRKVLIVLDQFEQWLHSKAKEENTELVQALRQCDGGRVQCVVMVRDDFWMVVTRFLRDLEVELVQGHNLAAVDLFDMRHAERVLKAYGRAYGALPESGREIEKEQEQFLKQAVSGLSQEGKVICVRLALFAEMIKGKTWSPAALAALGGTEGVGVAFLEEMFSSQTANPKHRLHQKAARAVLKALLPESGADIKGQMRSFQELLEVSGYLSRPKEFEDLIRILDGELRLITPTDPEGHDADDMADSKVVLGPKYYQLTHDYLVPSLRDWLTEKQRETRRGRTEMLLAERAGVWNAKPTTRHLPSLWEDVKIRLLTDHKRWTGPQRKMMRRAGRFHGIRGTVAGLIFIVALFAGWQINGRFQAGSLVKRLKSADIAEVPAIIPEFDGYRRWADPLLRRQFDEAPQGSNEKLNLALAILPVDQTELDNLRDSLMVWKSPARFTVVRDSLLPYKERVAEPLWIAALDPQREMQQRFQAACALATYAPDDKRWSQINALISNHLVTLEASDHVAFREVLRPAKGQLIESLGKIYRDPNQEKTSRRLATETLAEFAAESPDGLFSLLADGEQFQFPMIFAKLTAQKERAIALATGEVAREIPATANEDEKERLAKRHANAAVALLRLGSPGPVWPLLKASPDPRVRSYIINWLGPLEGDPRAILQRLEIEPDVSIRSALMLTLGQFTETQLPVVERQPLIQKLLTFYEKEADPGLHGACEWLLRKWGQEKQVDAILAKLSCDETQSARLRLGAKPPWYVNTQRQTFVLVEGHEFLMGLPESEPSFTPRDTQVHIRIGRTFAISAHEVTKAQYRAFQQAVKGFDPASNPIFRDKVRTDHSAQIGVNWFDAAHYCDWLSEQEKIPRAQWCYDPKGGVYGPGMKAKDKFWELTGYRLPTQAEWEFACRARTVTSRYYGGSNQLLPYYARFSANSQKHSWPVGTLQPNDFGLFDMLGNANEMCFDLDSGYQKERRKSSRGRSNGGAGRRDHSRVMRGGSFDNHPDSLRSGNSGLVFPGVTASTIGFRPVRTYR